MFGLRFKLLQAKRLPLAGLSLPVASMGKGLMPLRSLSTTLSTFRALSPMPKQPPSAYAIWLKELVASPKFSTPSGKRDAISITAVASPMWCSLPTTERAPYDAAAAAAKNEYNLAYSRWYNALTVQEIRDFEMLTGKAVLPPGGGVKRRKKAIDDRPGNPGKPLGSFIMFQEDMREKGLLKVKEIEDKMEMWRNLSIEAGRMWKELDKKERDRYTVAAKNARDKYDAWAATQPDLVTKIKLDKLNAKDQRRHRKYLELIPGAPKPPSSAWSIFCDAVRARGGVPVPPDVVGAKVAQYKSKKMGEMWRSLSDAAKAPYELEFENDKKLWKAWEAQHQKD